MTASSLAERLGYGLDEKLLIVNCDDLGSSASANRGIAAALAAGVASSATLMVPCPWALDGIARAAGGGIGVHLTLTCEYPAYRWRSLTGAASLHDRQGYMPATAEAVWARADLADVRAECRAQIDQAYAWGVDVTHLDAHMGVLQLQGRYLEVFLDVAEAYDLPVRMFGARAEQQLGLPGREMAADRRLLHPDHLTTSSFRPPGERSFADILASLRPGVTEVYFHPAEDGPELRAYDPKEAHFRVADHALMSSPELPGLIAAAGARLISFASLRDLQRDA